MVEEEALLQCQVLKREQEQDHGESSEVKHEMKEIFYSEVKVAHGRWQG